MHVYNNVIGRGNPKIRYWQDNGVTNDGLLFKILADNVKISGITMIADTANYKHSSLRAIEMTNYNNLTIENCTIINSVIRILNDSSSAMFGLHINNCFIKADFTYLHPDNNDQFDVFSIYGCKNIFITNNVILADSVSRIFKISEDRVINDDSDRISSRIFIDNNVIKGTGSRQAIDIYNGTQSSYFTNNYVNIKNFSELLSDKARYENWGSIIIRGNNIQSDIQAINIAGGYGKLEGDILPFDSLDQGIIIASNKFYKSSNDNTPLIDIRFSSNILLNDNVFSSLNKIYNYYPIFLGSTKSITISNNQSNWGGIKLDNVNHAFNTDLYKIDYRNVNINNNVIDNFNTPAAIFFDIDTSLEAHINISNNNINHRDTSIVVNAIEFKNDTINTVLITGNISDNKVYYASSKILNLVEESNSWNSQPVNYSATFDGGVPTFTVTYSASFTPSKIIITPTSPDAANALLYIDKSAITSTQFIVKAAGTARSGTDNISFDYELIK